MFDAQSGSFLPPSNLDKILRRDAGSLFDRCIVAAEIHDNAFTHAAQLAVIDSARRLGVESDGRPLMVGFEQFYTSHNDVLRRFVASGGSMTVDDLLQATDWDNTWGFDSTLYRPIFNYCQEHGIEMVGLNLPSKVTSFVAQNGIDALPPQIQSQLPSDMDFNNNQHFNHFADLMMKIAGSHGGGPHHFESQNNADGSGEVSTISAMLKRYYEVQVLWEEWMSYSAARCLEQFPDHRIVTLIGSAHVEERVGFPDRLEKRVRERPFTIVPRPVDWLSLQDDSYSIPDIYGPEENVADLVWYTHMA